MALVVGVCVGEEEREGRWRERVRVRKRDRLCNCTATRHRQFFHFFFFIKDRRRNSLAVPCSLCSFPSAILGVAKYWDLSLVFQGW